MRYKYRILFNQSGLDACNQISLFIGAQDFFDHRWNVIDGTGGGDGGLEECDSSHDVGQGRLCRDLVASLRGCQAKSDRNGAGKLEHHEFPHT